MLHLPLCFGFSFPSALSELSNMDCISHRSKETKVSTPIYKGFRSSVSRTRGRDQYIYFLLLFTVVYNIPPFPQNTWVLAFVLEQEKEWLSTISKCILLERKFSESQPCP